MTFIDKLIQSIVNKGTFLCIGIDPALTSMPPAFLRHIGVDPVESDAERCADALYLYGEEILDAVSDLVPLVKPQIAYYEIFGSAGIRALEKTISSARRRGLLVLLDAKRGDIGSTSQAYATAYLATKSQSKTEVDAITVSPYLGGDSLIPFFETAATCHKGVFVCARTSNPGANLLQELVIEGRAVYEIVGDLVAQSAATTMGQSGYSNLGVVVGATAPEVAKRMRQRYPNLYFLVTGIGTQGGFYDALRACVRLDGLGAIVNVSRSAIYPIAESQERCANSIRHNVQGILLDLARNAPVPGKRYHPGRVE